MLDEDPVKAAEYHCDKHVLKMQIESLQLMASVKWKMSGITRKKEKLLLTDVEIENLWANFPRLANGKLHPYGIGFQHHPCTKWAGQCVENWNWLVALTEALIAQHELRWKNTPNTKKILEWFKLNAPILPVNTKMTPYVLAMPANLKTANAVHSYRMYYALLKRDFATWKNQEPSWWKTYLRTSKFSF